MLLSLVFSIVRVAVGDKKGILVLLKYLRHMYESRGHILNDYYNDLKNKSM